MILSEHLAKESGTQRKLWQMCEAQMRFWSQRALEPNNLNKRPRRPAFGLQGFFRKIWRNNIMPKVTFQYEDGTSTIVDVTAGENLLEVARKANVAIDAPCSGNGSCGKCRVRYSVAN